MCFRFAAHRVDRNPACPGQGGAAVDGARDRQRQALPRWDSRSAAAGEQARRIMAVCRFSGQNNEDTFGQVPELTGAT